MGVGRSQVGVEPQRFEIRLARLDGTAQLAEGVAEVVAQNGLVGLEAHGLPAVGEGLVGQSAVEQHLAEVGPRRGKVGGQGDGLAKMVESLVGLAQLAERHAEVVVGRREVRPQLQRAAKLLDGFGVPSESLQRQTEVAKRLGGVGRQAQRRPAAADGSLVLTQGAVGFGQVGVEGGQVRPKRHGPADQLDGAGVVALLVAQHAEQVEGVGVLRLSGQDRLVQLRRRRQVPGLVLLNGGGQIVLHGRDSTGHPPIRHHSLMTPTRLTWRRPFAKTAGIRARTAVSASGVPRILIDSPQRSAYY